MQYGTEVVFTISYNRSGNIVEVMPAQGLRITQQSKPPYPVEGTTVLEVDTTIIVRIASSPDCWWITDTVTGEMTKVCE
jgi:hypothetical protein